MEISDPKTRRAGRRRRLLGGAKWLLIALALWLAARLLAGIGWDDLAARLGEARWPLVGLALAALVLRYVAWAWRWRLAVVRLGPAPSLLQLFLMLMAATTVNHVTPGARLIGGVLRGRYLARGVRGGGGGEISVGSAYGSVLYDQIVHQVAVVAISVAALVAAALAVGRVATAALIAGVAAVAGGAIALWLRRRVSNGFGARDTNPRREGRLARFLAERAARAVGRTRRLFDHGREAVDAVARLLGDGRLALGAAVAGLVIVLLNGLAQWVVFAALGSAPNFLVVLAVVAVGTAAGIALGTPGGAGTTEATMIAAFAALGVDHLAATAATLLYRGLYYASLFAVGGVALVGFEGFGGRRARAVGLAPAVPVAPSPPVSAEP